MIFLLKTLTTSLFALMGPDEPILVEMAPLFRGAKKNVWVLMLSEIAFWPTPLVGSKSTIRRKVKSEKK